MKNLPKLSELKEGDKIQHFVFGNLVDAIVTKVKLNGVETKHEPIQWGRETFTEGYVIKSEPLQAKYNNVVTPGAFKDGLPITIDGTQPIYATI